MHSVLPPGRSDVLGDLIGVGRYDWGTSGCRIIPGGIVDNLTSFGGVMKGDVTQTVLSEAIRYGAAGSSGTVCEPYAIQAKFAHPMIFVHYARGCNLAEAYYQSVQGPFQLLIVGDALCQPWARPVAFECQGIPSEPIQGQLTLNIDSEQLDAIGSIEVFIDGVRVMVAPPSSPIQINSRELPDGYHELRVVAIKNDLIATQSRKIMPILIDNNGERVSISLKSKSVGVSDNIVVQTEPRPEPVDIYHNFRKLATIAPGKESAAIPAAKIGAGDVPTHRHRPSAGQAHLQPAGYNRNPIRLRIRFETVASCFLMVDATTIQLLNQFNQSLKDCRNVYLRGASQVCQQFAGELNATPEAFTESMDDLHRGLLIKLFVSICRVDHLWSDVEEKMAGVLVFHLWQQSLNGTQVRRAIKHLVEQCERLDWHSLVEPFRRFPLLSERWPELETCVMRIGNLLAKCDGFPTSLELDELKKIQTCLVTYLNRSESKSSQNSAHSPPLIRDRSSPHQQQTFEKSPVETGGESKTPPDPKPAETDLPTLMQELQQLIGIDKAKSEVKTLVNLIKFQQHRSQAGLPVARQSLHLVFTGNPGTGKTTVARLLGRIFGAMGVLSRGHLIETDRSGLVAEYAGQTGPKTNRIVDTALDGILFIDEAYSLAANTSDDPYGQEAIQTLLKRMEDDRQRLVVILAGYPQPIERMLKSNPGLSSRFGRRIEFEDYLPGELGKIFGLFCKQNHFSIGQLAQARLMIGLDWLYQRRDEHFGNGRLVRNVFERAVRNMSNRVADELELTRELLTEFHAKDIDLEQVPPDELADEIVAKRRFEIVCPKCRLSSRLAANTLGRRVRCKSCNTRFTAEWCPPTES